jgi:hypothetical protein
VVVAFGEQPEVEKVIAVVRICVGEVPGVKVEEAAFLRRRAVGVGGLDATTLGYAGRCPGVRRSVGGTGLKVGHLRL